MKASPFSPLTLVSLLIGLALASLAQTGAYTVQLDSMTAQETAESKVQQLKAQGQNAYWLKSNVPGQGIRYRVRVGRFPNRVAAQNFGARLKQQGLTADFFVALFEGSSSPLGVNTPVKKVEPVPVLANTSKVVPVNNKAAENKTPVIPLSQRQREVKSSITPTNGVTQKPVANSPAAGNSVKPVVSPPASPITAPPTNNNASPQPAPASPTEYRPLQSKPPLPLEQVKPPRDKKASLEPMPPSSTTTLATAAAAKVEPPPVTNKAISEPVKSTPAPSASFLTNNFQRFEERSFGYSFEHPVYWNGGRLNPEELQAQRIDGGAVFRSQEDVAFMSAIWNSLKNANSQAYDNNLIVDLVIKSLSSSTGLQGLNEVSRRMVQEGDQIKTFVDLRTLFRQPRSNQSLEFQGKAVIIRANTGILLVVTFYAKDSASTMIAAADRIIGSARVP
jgi:hypothetical protein